MQSPNSSLCPLEILGYSSTARALRAGQAMPDGTLPAPGGWNRFQLQFKNIESAVDDLRKEVQNSGMRSSLELEVNKYFLKTLPEIL